MNIRPELDATFDDAAHMVVLMQSVSVNDLRVKLKLTDAKEGQKKQTIDDVAPCIGAWIETLSPRPF